MFVIEYLGEIETEFENTLTRSSGGQMGSNYEKKTGGRKSRDTLPLSNSGRSCLETSQFNFKMRCRVEFQTFRKMYNVFR